MSFFPLLMTCVATLVGGGLVLGSSQEAYKFGWGVLFYPLGASLGFLFLAAGIGKKLSKLQLATIAQIFEKTYHSTALKKIASLLSIITLFMILVAQFLASKKFMVSLGVDSQIYFIGFWGIVIAYTSRGGLKAVINTDIIQAVFFVFTFLICFFWVANSIDISFFTILESSLQADIFATHPSKIFGWLFMPLFFILIAQDVAQRCFAGDSSKIVVQATFWAGIFTFFLGMIPVFLGIVAREIGITVPAEASVLMTVVEQTTNPIISAAVGCAVLIAIISTADSVLNAISSNLSQDFRLFSSKNYEILASQLVTAGIASFAIFISYLFDNVLNVLVQSYELYVSILFIPIFIALFKQKGNFLSAVLSMIFGIIGFIFFRIVSVPVLQEIFSILLSLVGFGVGELIMVINKRKTSQILKDYQKIT